MPSSSSFLVPEKDEVPPRSPSFKPPNSGDRNQKNEQIVKYEEPSQEYEDRLFDLETGFRALAEHVKHLTRNIDAMYHSLDPNRWGSISQLLSYKIPLGTLTTNVNESKWMLNRSFQMTMAISAWHMSQNHFPDPPLPYEILESYSNAFTCTFRIQPKPEPKPKLYVPGPCWSIDHIRRLCALEARFTEACMIQYRQTRIMYEWHVSRNHFPDTCNGAHLARFEDNGIF